ncbi:putative kinase [Clostridium beijerinckii]|uniref:ATP-binding protein n=1 Tax=Clostridium beijerinckii TaxID=1520 RepID=UPI0014948C51|nr:ATP-binding protein [Clostridium beijerinckii]NOW89754.1 putative kinase [Clostridium beijerinckii]
MSKVIELNSYKTKFSVGQSKSELTIKNINKEKNKLYILIGIPCSGKSTYTSKYFTNLNTIIVSSDKIRKDLTETYEFSPKINNLVFDIVKNEVQIGLSKGFDVVVDATNTNKKYRKSLIKISKNYDCDTIAVVFKTPLSLCLERNFNRSTEIRVPEHIIIKMSQFDSNIKKSEGFDEINYL